MLLLFVLEFNISTREHLYLYDKYSVLKKCFFFKFSTETLSVNYITMATEMEIQ